MSKYAFPNLSKKQRQILDEIGCGNYSLAGVFPTPQAIKGLLERELIEKLGDKVVCKDGFGSVTVPEYQMPLPVHFVWCDYQSDEFDKEGLAL